VVVDADGLVAGLVRVEVIAGALAVSNGDSHPAGGRAPAPNAAGPPLPHEDGP
jgi:hypothetical protein